MLVHIDWSLPVALYDQIAAQLRGAIVKGEVATGDRLPAAQTLAAQVGVNVHTVLRAYAQLRAEGLIELRPYRGAVVASSGAPRAELVQEARRLVGMARHVGLSSTDILKLVGDQL